MNAHDQAVEYLLKVLDNNTNLMGWYANDGDTTLTAEAIKIIYKKRMVKELNDNNIRHEVTRENGIFCISFDLNDVIAYNRNRKINSII